MIRQALRIAFAAALPLVATTGCGPSLLPLPTTATPSRSSTTGTPLQSLPPSPGNPSRETAPAPPAAASKPGGMPPDAAPEFLTPTTPFDGKTLSEWIDELGSRDPAKRTKAVSAVRRYGRDAKDAVPALVRIIDDPRDPAFPAAAETLAAFGPVADAAVPRLTELLKHADLETSRSAAEALGCLGPAAGRAVPALIDLIGGDDSKTDKRLRDSAALALGKFGKYDVGAVFDAFRAKRIPESLLKQVIDSLGLADADAADALAVQMSRKDPRTLNLAASGLRKIGPAAWPAALPELRILLGSSDPQARKCAEDVLEEIVPPGLKGVPPKGSFLPKASPLYDLPAALEQAGFDGRQGWGHHLANFVRFGTKAEADKYWRGDAFDRIEVERTAKDHRAKVRAAAYRVRGLSILPVVRDDIETIGLVAELPLPLRVSRRELSGTTGLLSGVHPFEANTGEHWFLTKDGSLRPCSPQDAETVRRNNGVIYHPETPETTLVLIFKGKLADLRDLARNAKDYTVDLELSELCHERPGVWGYYRSDLFVEARWDSQRLRADSLVDVRNPQPGYFPTASLGKDSEKIPECVRGRLDSVRIRKKDGRLVGEFSLK